MSDSAYGAYLQEARQEFVASLAHLEYSFASINRLPEVIDGCGEEALEKVDAFTSRYARVIDLWVNRVLRAIDRFELNEPGSLIDIANRAEARGLVKSVDWLRELKDVRNRIAHDYAGAQLVELLTYCRQTYPELQQACQRTVEHIDQLL